jgi:sulfur carrier protein
MPRVTVLHSPAPRDVREQAVDLPEGATVADALAACGLPVPDDAARDLGIWGRKAEAGQVLRERDRVEVYRPLLVDPKVARRERFRRQGARAAGLFASRRPGSKPGY